MSNIYLKDYFKKNPEAKNKFSLIINNEFLPGFWNCCWETTYEKLKSSDFFNFVVVSEETGTDGLVLFIERPNIFNMPDTQNQVYSDRKRKTIFDD